MKAEANQVIKYFQLVLLLNTWRLQGHGVERRYLWQSETKRKERKKGLAPRVESDRKKEGKRKGRLSKSTADCLSPAC